MITLTTERKDTLAQTQEHLCELPDCDRPSPHGAICYQCVEKAQEGIEAIEPEQLLHLLLIARGEAKPANPNLIGNGTKSGPHDVLNLVVFSLLQDITRRWPEMLKTMHRKTDAVHQYRQMMAGIKACHHLTVEQDNTTVTNEYLAKRMKEIGTMQPNDLVPYMQRRVGVKVTRNQIDLWRHRGLLQPAKTIQRTVFYHPADVLRAMENRDRQPAT